MKLKDKSAELVIKYLSLIQMSTKNKNIIGLAERCLDLIRIPFVTDQLKQMTNENKVEEDLEQENNSRYYQLKEQLAVRDKNIVDFINELAWHDAQYYSIGGGMPASRSDIPFYARRYFRFWKELFNEDLEQAKESINNGI